MEDHDNMLFLNKVFCFMDLHGLTFTPFEDPLKDFLYLE